MISVNTGQMGPQTNYLLKKLGADNYAAEVDWANSPGVNSGGYSLDFTQDTLEVRGADQQGWEIQVAPPGAPNSVWVRKDGCLHTEGLSEVNFPTPIAAENSRKVAMQVASAVIGIPFLDALLEQQPPS